MSGALIELVAKGVQDAYLTGDPQVSFFRDVYKRHTNFAFAPTRLDYVGAFTAGNEVSIPIISKGDMLSYVWLEAEGINDIGVNTSLFVKDEAPSQIRLYIGGQIVDTQDAMFSSLVWPNASYSDTSCKTFNAPTWAAQTNDRNKNWFPLHFFFSDAFKRCLPLVALQYHEVEIRITLGASCSAVATPKVYANFVYLDTDERQWFVDNPREMLIPQVQRLVLDSPTSTTIDVSYFNHPVQAMHFASTYDIGTANNATTRYDFDSLTTYINGTPLRENVSNVYAHDVVPYFHSNTTKNTIQNPLYTIPFATQLSWSQPYGSLNFSRIDNATVRVKNPSAGSVTAPVYVYAVNWNILRIKQGMAGLAFGN